MNCTKCMKGLPSVTGKIRCSCGQVNYSDEFAQQTFVPGPVITNDVALAGRIAWKALHEFSMETWNSEYAKAWYVGTWMPMIPKYCSCEAHWDEITGKLPPDFSSQEAFSVWAIDAHDQVNARLKKPLFKKDSKLMPIINTRR